MPADSELPPAQFNQALNAALKKIQQPELFKYTTFLLGKHPEKEDYWQWLAAAPEAEILAWIQEKKGKP